MRVLTAGRTRGRYDLNVTQVGKYMDCYARPRIIYVRFGLIQEGCFARHTSSAFTSRPFRNRDRKLLALLTAACARILADVY